MTARRDSELLSSDYADTPGPDRNPLVRPAMVIGGLIPILIAASIVALRVMRVDLDERDILIGGLGSLSAIPLLMWALTEWRGRGKGFANWIQVFIAATLVWVLEVVACVLIFFGFAIVWWLWR